MLCYCKKCGRMVSLLEKELNEPCDYCRNITQPVPSEYLNDTKIFIKPNLEQQFIDEYIKSSPEFDQYLFDHRDEDLFNRRMENRAKLEHGKVILEEQARTPKCPTCGSTNIEKISVAKKAFGGAMFGIFSSDVRNTMHCKKCGAKW